MSRRIDFQVGFTTDKTGLNELESLLRQIDLEAARPGNKLNESLQKAGATAQQLRAILEKSYNKDLGTVNVTKFTSELQKSKVSLAEVKANLVGAGASGQAAFNTLGTAIIGANAHIKQSNKLLNDMATTFANTVRFGISSSVFNNMSNSIQKAYNYSVQLDKSLNDIRIVTGDSADKMDEFAIKANEAAKNLGASTLDYTNAALIYYQQGLSAEESQKRAEITLKTANVTGQTGEEVSEQLTAVWNGYKVSASEAELYIDKLAAIAASTAADLEELSTGMSKVASAANSAGVDVDQLSSILSTVISVTREAPETVGSAFKTIFARMGDLALDGEDEYGVKLGKVSSQMQELGIQILDQNGQMRDMGDIIEDTAAKWQTWTQAQKQAAAVAMAGKMQYSRLIALFDNWDMYEKSMLTAAEAAGTLNEQQAIYLDSTTARLNKLKATAQDLYKGLLDEDELNTGIDALRDLIQMADNFLDSFGGGLKSITATATVLAQIFNKQLSSAIAGAMINRQKMNQNANLLNKKREAIGIGSAEMDVNASPEKMALAANYETQLKYAADIDRLQKSISTEKYNELTAMQQQMGQLEQEAVLIEKKATANSKEVLDRNEFLRLQSQLNSEEVEYFDISSEWGLLLMKQQDSLETTQTINKELKSIFNWTEKNVAEEEECLEYVSQIEIIMTKLNGKYKSQIDALTKDKDLNELTRREKDKILKIVEKIEAEEKAALGTSERKAKAVEDEIKARQKAEAIRNKEGQVEVDFQDSVDLEQKTGRIMQNVSTITSALSGLTMAWSSVNSLIQTWSDEQASLGDKITQTVMSATMTIPMLISSFNGLKTALGATSTVMEVMNTTKAAGNALDKAGLATDALKLGAAQKRDVELTKQLVLEQILNREHEKGNLLGIQSVAGLSAETAAELLKTGATAAETKAVEAATVAQNAYNASLLANPITWVILALAGAVAIIGGVTAAISAQNEKIREANDLAIEQANAKQAKIDANEELYTSYLNVYDAYKNNMASKEDMEKVTDDLVEILGKEKVEVAKLTGNYAELTEEILRAQKAAAEEGLRTAETEREKTGANMMSKAIEGEGHKTNWGEGDNNYGVWLSGWGGEEKQATDILRKNIDNSWVTSTSGDSEIDVRFEYTKDNMVKFYDQMVEARKQMQEEMNATDLANSGVYQEVNDWIEKMKDDVEAYKNALADVARYKTQIEAANINFRDVTDVEDLSKKRQQLIDYMKTLEEFKGKSDEEIEKVADTYIGGVSDNTNKLLTRLYAVNDLTEKFGEESRQKIIEALKDIPEEDLSYALQVDEQTSFDNLDSFIERAKLRAQEHNIQTSIDNTNEIYDKLSSGKTLTKDEQEALTSLENEYEDLQQIRDKTSDDYLNKLRSIREALEDQLATVKALKTNDAIEDAQEKISNLMDDFYSIADGEVSKEEMEVTVNADTEAFTEAIDNVLDADYETVITVKADMNSDFNSAIDMMDEAEKMAGKIGESFIVDNENLRELNKSFPGILDGITDLHDGTSRLSQDAVAVAMANSKGIIATTTQEAVTRMKAEQQIVLGKAQAAEKIAMLANQMANSETMTEEQKAQTIGQIQDELGKFVTNVDEDTNEIKTNNDAAVVDSANTNNQILTDNAAKAYSSMAQNSAEYADQAIANIEKVNAAAAGQEGGTGTYSAISSHYNGTSADTSGKDKLSKYEGGKNLDLNTDKGQWEQLAASAAAQAKTYREIYNDYTGMIAQLSSSVSGIDDVFKNATAGKGGKSTASKNKSGGEKEKDPDKMDAIENEKDRYHDVNIELKQIETELGRIQKQKDKLLGQDLIDNLNKQLNLLNKQIDKTNEKISIAKDEVGELRSKLSIQGVSFNNDGTIANYTQAYEAQLGYVNALVAKYNSMSAKEQEGFKETVEQAKKDFETFTENMEKYDELVSDTIPGLQDEIQDAIDQQIEIQIEKFNMEIEIRLNLKEAELEWNEFKKKIIDGIKDDNILGNANARLQDYNAYYKNDNTGIIQRNTEHINAIRNELLEMDRTGWSKVYGDNRAQALEDLQTYYQQMMEDLQEIEEIQEDIHDSYLDMIDEAQEGFDKQLETYEQISSLIEHDMKLIELVYGEENYEAQANYYQKQDENYRKQLEFQRVQKDFWWEQMQTMEEGSEEWEAARENWMSAVDEWKSSLNDAIENITDKYLNAINLIFQKLNDEVTSGKGLDYVSEQWELINQNADQYLDTINSMYGIQKLENKYLDAIDQTDSISAQRKLNDLMKEEVAALEKKDKLTQYDIDRANMKYEIALKQIALEEAQQNKSTMRLRRDSQGNYSYQFVSDEDSIAQTREELQALYNELYNFDLSAYRDNLDQLLSVWTEYQEKMAEAAQINDPVKRAEKEALIQEQYGQLINGIVAENEVLRTNLHESAFTELADLYNVDVENFQNMTDTEKEILMSDMIPQWTSGVQQMADVFADEDEGFIGVCKKAMEDLADTTEEYMSDLEDLEDIAGVTYDEITEGTDDTIDKTETLLEDNQELIDKYGEQLEAIRKIIIELNSLISKYNSAKQAAMEATEAAYKYWQEQKRQEAEAAAKEQAKSTSNNNNNNSNSSSSSSGRNGTGSGGDGVPRVGDICTYIGGTYYYDSYGTSPSGNRGPGKQVTITQVKTDGRPYPIHVQSSNSAYGWLKKEQLSGYDTGGYTGNWGDNSGRLALLHQKELVLNADDTPNLLKAVSIMRNITDSIGSNILAQMAGVKAPTGQVAASTDTIEQIVQIDANFPNVQSSDEIKTAINDLVNRAAQRVHRKR